MKYHIWTIPSQPVYNELSNVINNLSNKYKSPIFKPHLTILGSIDRELNIIQDALEIVTKNTKKLNLSFGAVSFSTTYFQSVFVRVNSTAQLMQLNLDIKKILNIENQVFMPHISLMYGDHDMKTREEVAVKVQLQNSSFIADRLVIIPNKLEPKEWEPIATFPL